MKQWTIGRAPDCAIVVDHPRVSRLHAYLIVDERGPSLRDAGTPAGTTVNGAGAGKGVAVRAGDTVLLGKVALSTNHGVFADILRQYAQAAPRDARLVERLGAGVADPQALQGRAPHRHRRSMQVASALVIGLAAAAVVGVAVYRTAGAGDLPSDTAEVPGHTTQVGVRDSCHAEVGDDGIPDCAYRAVFMVAVEVAGVVQGLGSGFVTDRGTAIVTNMHVAEPIEGCLADPRCTPWVIGHERAGHRYEVVQVVPHPRANEIRPGPFSSPVPLRPDVALLILKDPSDLPPGLPLASGGDVDNRLRGKSVFAVGFPGDTMDPTNPIATISRGDVGRVIDHEYIQHEANITPGSSGSPLLVSGPRVIGINYAGVGIREVPVRDNATGQFKLERINQASGLNLAAGVGFITQMF